MGASAENHEDSFLDCRRSISAFTFLKVSQSFRTMAGGAAIEILLDGPEAREDLLKFMNAYAWDLVQTEDKDGFSRLILRKRIPQAPRGGA
jgi:TusA-related sulfurtransferase